MACRDRSAIHTPRRLELEHSMVVLGTEATNLSHTDTGALDEGQQELERCLADV